MDSEQQPLILDTEWRDNVGVWQAWIVTARSQKEVMQMLEQVPEAMRDRCYQHARTYFRARKRAQNNRDKRWRAGGR